MKLNLKKKNKWVLGLVAIFLLLGLFLPSISKTVFAEPLEKTEIAVTDFTILNKTTGNPATSVAYDETFSLKMTWNASFYTNTLKENDFFIAKLPDNMVFPNNSASRFFDIMAEDGVTVVAKAEITPMDPSGGEVKVVFTDYVVGRSDIHGTMRMDAKFNRDTVKRNEVNTFEVAINGNITEGSIPVTGPVPVTGPIGKFGAAPDDGDEKKVQ